jgi:cytochrome c peroxidase
MKVIATIVLISSIVVACSVSARQSKQKKQAIPAGTYEDTLRFLYSLSRDQWPAPSIDPGVSWQELGIIPDSPLKPYMDSLKHLILLGKTLFFDPRLSGSNQISCASCHIQDLSWTDGRAKSVGHDQQPNKRNSPTLLNVWYFKHLFWDGRSKSLEDQAFSPINSETEMHSDISEVMRKLRRIPGYKPLFDSAFHGEGISPETVTSAIAVFQRTLVSRKSDFDHFLSGKKQALNDAALRGLHLFRTKARCMNCHNGPLFTDNDFHNIGLTYYQREYEDLGRYNVTHRAEDVGRFKTPSLRDVIRTRPWMHNGLFDNLNGILNMYSAGMAQPKPEGAQLADTLFPKTDKLLRKLDLTRQEKEDIIAFLNAITAEPLHIGVPALPR